MKKLWFAVLFSTGLAACSSPKDITLGTGSGSSGGAPADGAVEVPVLEGTFSLELTTPPYATHILHKAGTDYSAPCAIDPTATGADRFIECEVEVDELDLLMHGLSFRSKISSHNCAHVTYRPYYYLSAPAGQGPTQVEIEINSGAITDDPNGFSVQGEPYCPFDYSFLNEMAPNCCFGEYTLVIGGTTPSTTTADWGGSAGNCVSGAGVLDPLDSEGWPVTVYLANSARPGTGLQISKKYDSVMGIRSQALTVHGATNDIVVNGDHPLVNGSGFGFLGMFFANYSTAALWGGELPDGMASPYYELTCLDSAHEETARIRLRVREWNVKGVLSPAHLANADQGGWDSFNRPNNDFGDWDDAAGMVDPAPPAYSPNHDPGDYLHYREGYPYQHMAP